MSRPNLFRDLRVALYRPAGWAYSTWLRFLCGYRTNRFGLFWAFVPTAMYVFGIGWFMSIFSPADRPRLMGLIAIGWVMFRLLTSVLLDCTTAFQRNQPFILEGRTNYVEYILAAIFNGVIHVVVALPVASIALWLSGIFMPAGVVGAVAGFFISLVNLFFWGVLVALVAARFPDMRELIGNATMFLFLITPIFWSPSSVPAGSSQAMLLNVNPLYHLLAAVRAPVLSGETFTSISFIYLSAVTLIGILLSFFAYATWAPKVSTWLR